MNFAWSLRPIFIWLTIWTGLDFDRSQKKNNIRRWVLRFFSLLWLTFSISVDIGDIADLITQLIHYTKSTDKDGASIIGFWNKKISWIIISILFIGFHFSVFVSALVKWKPLWKKIKLVQLNFNYPTTSYRRLHRETFVGLLPFSMVKPRYYFFNVFVWNLIRWFNQSTTNICLKQHINLCCINQLLTVTDRQI